MAVDRNLQFYGFAYGDTPVTLDVKVNGQQVFLNTVSTIPGEVPIDTQDITCDQILFEVNNTALFPITVEGSYTHSIEVTGGAGILIGPILSNYMTKLDPISNVVIPGNATGFVNVYNGNPTNSEGTPDARSSVKMDNVTQVPPVEESKGCWTWEVDTGSNLSCNLNISLGSISA
jgi:hypothetical protein